MNARDDEKIRAEALHRLLARSLRQSLEAGGADCPAPEILAAYFDRSLTSSEASHWESHFSVCGRCQQILAALARSEFAPAAADETQQIAALVARAATPEAQPPRDVHALRRYLRWNWLVPVAAAAAALALWIAIRPAPRTSVEVARENQTAAPATGIAPQAPAQASKELAQNVPPAPPPAIKRRAEAATPSGGASNKTGREQYARAAPNQPGAGKETLTADAAQAPSAGSGTLGRLTPPPAISREKGEADEERKAQRRDAVSVAAAPVSRGEVAAESAATPQAAAKTAEAKQAQAQSGLAASGATAQISRAKPKAIAADRVAYRSALVVVASPSRSVLWRVGSGGSIERSRDAGRTWQPQESNVAADLLAGSAQSETVCWVVGRAGTILRTTDGEHWEKIPSPVLLDWNAVEARDRLNATVTAGTARYSTTDGGRIWQASVSP